MFAFSIRSRMRRAAPLLTALGLSWLFAVPAAHAEKHVHQHAHQHGTAKLDVAVESRHISLHLDSPLANLIGFERAPRTAAERKLAADAVAQLRAPGLFAIDPAAQCTLVQVELSSAALGIGGSGKQEPEQAGHADIDGDFRFDCADATQATWIDVGLFNFARMQKLEVQLATPSGQFRRDLARPSKRLSLKK